MKIRKYVAATVLVACFSFCFSAQAETATPVQKRIYINSHAVKVTKGGISIVTEKGLVQVSTLHSDKNGIFVLESEMTLSEKAWYQCPHCGKILKSGREYDGHVPYCEKR